MLVIYKDKNGEIVKKEIIDVKNDPLHIDKAKIPNDKEYFWTALKICEDDNIYDFNRVIQHINMGYNIVLRERHPEKEIDKVFLDTNLIVTKGHILLEIDKQRLKENYNIDAHL